ncbi:MAG: haloacid dehalogenase type II [Bacteroidota bacterium]
MNQIKAYVFDAFGTLFKVNIPSEQLDDLTDGKGKTLLAIWRQKQLEYTWLRTLMNNWIDFDQVTADALKYAAQSLRLENYDALATLLMPIYREPECFEDVLPALQSLKIQSIPTAILSNGTPKMLATGIQTTALVDLIDYTFSASRVAQFKVAPDVYQMVLDKLNLQADKILFFSSNAWDIAGAKHFGFQTVWVNRNQQVFEELGVQPDWEIHALTQWKYS